MNLQDMTNDEEGDVLLVFLKSCKLGCLMILACSCGSINKLIIEVSN